MLARLSGFNGKALFYSTHGKIQSSIPARNPIRIIHAELKLWNTTAYVLRAVQRRTMLQWWTPSSCRSCTSSTPPAGWSNSLPSPVPQWRYGTARSRFSLRHGWPAAINGFRSLELDLFTIAGRYRSKRYPRRAWHTLRVVLVTTRHQLTTSARSSKRGGAKQRCRLGWRRVIFLHLEAPRICSLLA